MLPSPPSSKDEEHELADFAELLAIKNGSVSSREIVSYLSKLCDNHENVGCDDDESETTDEMEEVMAELDRRMKACGSGYPFTLAHSGSTLRHENGCTNPRSTIYRYLLLATRLNMKSARVHKRIDGTKLLEDLSAVVIKNYLGSRSRSLVFGTAVSGGFAKKISGLCQELREGGQFKNPDIDDVDENDGGIDTVGWVPFSDRKRGQLIVFGQCKTGTNWRDETVKLRPDDFVRLWMSDPPLLTPIRAFFIAESAEQGHWVKHATKAGLLFDRCRLVDFSETVPKDLIEKIETWTCAALDSVKF